MSPEKLVAGTEWAARRFYSPSSISRQLKGSRAGLWWNAPRNLGYHLALRRFAFRGVEPGMTRSAGETLWIAVVLVLLAVSGCST